MTGMRGLIHLLLVSCSALLPSTISGPTSVANLSDGWTMCRESNEDECIEAIVPGTVLTSSLANGTFAPINLSNVYMDDNISSLPDIASVGPEFFTFVSS